MGTALQRKIFMKYGLLPAELFAPQDRSVKKSQLQALCSPLGPLETRISPGHLEMGVPTCWGIMTWGGGAHFLKGLSGHPPVIFELDFSPRATGVKNGD